MPQRDDKQRPQETGIQRTRMEGAHGKSRDDEGNIIGRKTRKDYVLKVNKGRIGEIEEAVKAFKNESLSDITYDLFAHAQAQESDALQKRKR